MAARSAPAVTAVRASRARSAAVVGDEVLPAALPADALDDRIAIVDPLGVWWGLRASADGSAPGYPVIVSGGRHADVPITARRLAG